MSIKFNPKKFFIYFILVSITNVIVIFLWDLIFHGKGTFDLGFSLTLGLIVGIILSFIDVKK